MVSEFPGEGATTEKALSPLVWCLVLSGERRMASEEGGWGKMCDGGGDQ